MNTNQHSFRRSRLLRLSLRTLMLAIVVIAVLLGGFAVPARSQLRSRQWVESQRGRVYLVPEYRAEAGWYVANRSLPLPKGLVDTLGIDYFASARLVILDCEEIYDLSGMTGLIQLEELYVNQFVHDVRAFRPLVHLRRLKKVTLSKSTGLSRDAIASISNTLSGVEVVTED